MDAFVSWRSGHRGSYEYRRPSKRNTRSLRPTRALMTARARFTAVRDDEFEEATLILKSLQAKVFLPCRIGKLKSHAQSRRALTGSNGMRYFRVTRSVCPPAIVSLKF